jgi:hypothetical protein
VRFNCIFAKPAGRRITRSSVAWYDVTFRQLIDDYFNTGDLTVYDSTLKLLNYNRSARINIDAPVDRALASQLNDLYDYVVLRASNYIHEEMEWGYFADWLDALHLPGLCLGIGAQAATRRRILLPPLANRIWHMIAERSPSIGVRGEFTASVLEDNGIRNLDIVGCPSIFRACDPNLQLRHKAFSDIRRVGFSLRRETGDNYTENVVSFLNTQKELILRFNALFELVLTVHGEIEEKVYYYNDISRLAAARQTLRDMGWFDSKNEGELEAVYESRLFFAPVVSYYDDLVRELDCTLGYRVHGVLPALAAGTPSVLLRYDERSAELARTLKVPLLEPDEALREDVQDLFHPNRFKEFEENYPKAYEVMRSFLEKHEVAHLMGPPVKLPA